MITASHNPKNFNGLKLASGFSETLLTDGVQKIRGIAENGKFKKFDREGKYEEKQVFEQYLSDLYDKAFVENLSYKIVIDTLNATAGKFMPQVLRKSGCNIIEKNVDLDGSFPLGTPDPTERDVVERLAGYVVEEKADLGVCYDPDGDRIGIVDSDGNPIWNDVLVAILAKDTLEYMPGAPIVYNALCSKATSDAITAAGGIGKMCRVGHSFVKAAVKEENAPFGGELSGHLFFLDDFYGHEDTGLATLRVLNYMKKHNKSLKELVSELPKYISSPEIKLGLSDDIKFKLIDEKIGPDIKTIFPTAQYTTIDGFRADTTDEMAIVRASQNGPYITIKFEGKTQQQYDNLKKKLSEILHKYSEIDWAAGVNIHAFE